MRKISCFVWVGFLIGILCCCSKSDDQQIIYTYQIPEQVDDGWEVATLASVNLNTTLIEDLVSRIANGDYSEVHSIVIIKDDKLVLDEYFPGHDFSYAGDNFHGSYIEFDRERRHNTHSATKSVVSALIGIAIDNGFMNGINDKIFTYFTEYSNLNDDQKDRITVEYLLTMSSGFEWNEWTVPPGDPEYDTYLFNISDDPVEYILSKPIVSEPGTTFNYNGATVDLLGEIIRISSGLRPDAFSDDYLFGPMGISSYRWQRLPTGLVVAHGDIYMRPRDMAKFGYLYLNNGNWNGEQIISEEWVQSSMQDQIQLPYLGWADGYGYLWWIRDLEYNGQTITSYKAMGWGGQEIFIFPTLDMVIVFTGANYVSGPSCDNMVVQYILPSTE